MNGDLTNWIMVEDNFDISKNKHYEGALCQGNGYFSVRASFEEGINSVNQGDIYERGFKSVTTEIQRNPISKWGTYVPTIMGSHPNLNEVIINLPYFMDFSVSLNGEKLDMKMSKILNYKRALNLKDGTLVREFIWISKDDLCKIRLRFERFASMKQKHLFVQKIEAVILEGNGNLIIESGINGDVTTNGYNHFVEMSTNILSDALALKCKTDIGNNIMELCKLSCDNVDFHIVKDDTNILYKGFKSVCKDEKYVFEKHSVILTDRDLEEGDLAQRGLNLLKSSLIPYEQLYIEHRQVLEKKWDMSDVKIVGDDIDQLSMRFSIYHLLRSNNEEDSRQAICAKGFAGEAYYGRYFWDTEIFLLPFYIYTNPKAARNLLMYRYNTLVGAKENAKKYNCRGARYPWQSSLRGDEQCSLWEYADNEVHITADITYGIWHYFTATNDYDFLINYGSEILIETARFWCDRIDKNSEGGYDLINVMGPDEYSAMTLNNAFTNRMVKFNLIKAVECLEIIRNISSSTYEKFLVKLSIAQEELNKFLEITEKLKVPMNIEEDYILQSEDFEKYANINMDDLWKDKTKPFGFYVTQEKLYRSKCLKQADALALAMLFKNEFTLEQIANTYNYYEPLTTHDSSLSPVNHAIVAAWIKNNQHLDKFLNYAMELDFKGSHGGAEDGIHIANCGCLWQLIMTGISGIDTAINSDILQAAKPILPKAWEKVEFKLIWKGLPYKVEVNKESTKICNI